MSKDILWFKVTPEGKEIAQPVSLRDLPEVLEIIENSKTPPNWLELTEQWGGGRIHNSLPIIQDGRLVGYEFIVINPNHEGDDFLTRKIHL